MYNYIIGPTDTDSISFCKPDMSNFTKEEIDNLVKEINEISPEMISWDNDGYYKKIIILRAKNYILYDGEKITLKGSSLKSANLEPALKEFLMEVIKAIIFDKTNELPIIYNHYKTKIENITDITPWCRKLTLSDKTFDSQRKNETDIIEAIKGKEYNIGDRIYVYTKVKTVELEDTFKRGPLKGQKKTKEVSYLCLKEDFDGEFDKQTYIDKLEKCLHRFETIPEIMEKFK